MRRALISSWVVVAASVIATQGLMGAPAPPRTPASKAVRSAVAEVAPAELGALRSVGQLALATSPKGEQVYVFDGAKDELLRFHETGRQDGDGVALTSPQFSIQGPIWLAANSSQVAVATSSDAAVFELEGKFLGTKKMFLVSSIAALPNGDWAVGVTQMSKRAGFFMRGSKDGPRPRVVALDSEAVIVGSGLNVESFDYSESQGAARALLLVSGRKRLYAVEAANYKIYELDSDFKLHAVLSDPKIQLEEPKGAVDPAKKTAADTATKTQIERDARALGGDVTKAPPSEPVHITGGSFDYKLAVLAAAWDSHDDCIVLLLDRGVGGSGYALDCVNPVSLEVRRVTLRLPGGDPDAPALSQIAVGARYIWLRSRLGTGPTLRVDREAFEGTSVVTVLARE